jgi:hypothetical protein
MVVMMIPRKGARRSEQQAPEGKSNNRNSFHSIHLDDG